MGTCGFAHSSWISECEVHSRLPYRKRKKTRTVEATSNCLKVGGCIFRSVLWTRVGSFDGRSSSGWWRVFSPDEDFLRECRRKSSLPVVVERLLLCVCAIGRVSSPRIVFFGPRSCSCRVASTRVLQVFVDHWLDQTRFGVSVVICRRREPCSCRWCAQLSTSGWAQSRRSDVSSVSRPRRVVAPFCDS